MLAALGVLGYAFVRSAQSSRATPYTVPAADLAGWRVTVDAADGGSGRVVSLTPGAGFVPGLFPQVFSRAGETLAAPSEPGLPLVVEAEFARMGGALTAADIAALAREAGLEGAAVQPRCMVHRRVSEPRLTRQVYFVLFDLPAFQDFRQRVAARLAAAGAAPAAFDPAALSPAVIVAASDAVFSRWLPLTADPAADCVAPVVPE